MYYKNQVPNLFYELKYDFTVYDQFFYDALVTTMLPCMIYSHTIFPAPTVSSTSKKLNQARQFQKKILVNLKCVNWFTGG